MPSSSSSKSSSSTFSKSMFSKQVEKLAARSSKLEDAWKDDEDADRPPSHSHSHSHSRSPSPSPSYATSETIVSADGRSIASSELTGELAQLLNPEDDEEEVEMVYPLSDSEVGGGGGGGGDRVAAGPTVLTSQSKHSVYGRPLPPPKIVESMPPGEGGVVWHATVIPDVFVDPSSGRLKGGLAARDFDVERRIIKPRRGSLSLTATDLLSSLTKLDDDRYVFSGVLNGWPALRCLELLSLERKRRASLLPNRSRDPNKNQMLDQLLWVHHWAADREGPKGIPPTIADSSASSSSSTSDGAGAGDIYRAKLRGAPWTGKGWSATSPGFLFWFEYHHRPQPRVTYGTDTLEAVGDAECTMVHMVSHRYAVARESARDKITYHSIVLLEWDHGEFCTVVEGAFRNGMGGYRGRSNFFHDRDAFASAVGANAGGAGGGGATALYKAMPTEMIAPWLSTASEIRCMDVEARGFDEFRAFVEEYSQPGPRRRFIDPRFTFSHPARLTFRSRAHISQYLINYVSRDNSYSEIKRNCQTLSADLCGFLAGKKGVEPFHPVNRIEYRNRTHLFLYDSTMYEK